jgi:hypothetical protein
MEQPSLLPTSKSCAHPQVLSSLATVKSDSLRQVRDSGSGRRMGGACMSVRVNFAPKIAFNRGLVPRLQAIKTQPSSTTQLPLQQPRPETSTCEQARSCSTKRGEVNYPSPAVAVVDVHMREIDPAIPPRPSYNRIKDANLAPSQATVPQPLCTSSSLLQGLSPAMPAPHAVQAGSA